MLTLLSPGRPVCLRALPGLSVPIGPNAMVAQERESGSWRRPSIMDVAKRAGFSHMTVSRVMNNHAGVSPKTRARVLRVAEEMGYRLNASARQMKTGVTNRWGILLPQLRNPSYAELFEALDRTVFDLGHLLSGHTLKHLAAAAAGWFVCRMLLRRSLCAPLPAHA